MDLSTVKQIHETKDLDSCNAYLALGWVLLQTASMDTDSREYSGPIIKYALGWTQDGEPAKPDNRFL